MILKKDAFKNIPRETLDSLKELMASVEGKSLNDTLMIIMKFQSSMPKTKPLSADEQKAVVQAIMEGLDKNEQEKFAKIIALFNMA